MVQAPILFHDLEKDALVLALGPTPMRLSVFDAFGRVVMPGRQVPAGASIDVAMLSSGCYVALACTEVGVCATVKWVKP